ncbi:dCTP deaminase [Acetobacterium paludosum]|uniref:dCTP deaminase, dUMP-forming n=2 Tax=Acetobacterium TaxID=33951 RepID=A0A923HXV5_9FIRM|nr:MULTISPECIES: dCTP deaminase [Acetobacterium]MBC3797423.1 dCTP deaminase [Acetobacterium tundrae]MBC3889137.1 dCTP deaminase [Acetobacterium paludosum]
MILSDRTIYEYLEKGELVIDPLEKGQVQPASVDIRLGSSYLKLDENHFETMTLTDEIKYVSMEADEIIIPSNSFLLATTMEYIKLPCNLTAFVEGRSSVGRMGLFIQNAGWVDPGFEGEITLELYNANRLPIKLEKGRRICQLVFAQMDAVALNPYHGKYQKQRSAVGSRIFMDDEC